MRYFGGNCKRMERKKFLILVGIVTIFSISMGLMESAVVVYLREIYYKTGFHFPLVPIDKHIANTELYRELATLVMLIGIGYMAGRNLATRFAWFIYSFAIWDIFYYVFLKAFLNWPDSLMTDDILFLIPVAWVGPVITPVIVALTMILFAIIILFYDLKFGKIWFNKMDWIFLILGSITLIIAFGWDYSKLVSSQVGFKNIWIIPGSDLFDIQMQYIPKSFNWFLFSVGEGIILFRLIWFWRRQLHKTDKLG